MGHMTHILVAQGNFDAAAGVASWSSLVPGPGPGPGSDSTVV